MNTKPVWIVMLLVGMALLIVGLVVANSANTEVQTDLSATPANQALWMMVGGAVVALIGAGGLIGWLRAHRVV